MHSTNRNKLWEDSELKVAIDYYLYLLQMQLSDVSVDRKIIKEHILLTKLHKRTEASLRYRMRNISFVFQKQNWPTLECFSPAPQVGSGVKNRILNIVNHYPNQQIKFLKHRSKNNSKKSSSKPITTQDIKPQLKNLLEALEDFEFKHFTMGHNNPPKDKMFNNQVSQEIQNIKSDLSNVIDLIQNSSSQRNLIEKFQEKLLLFGHALWVWTSKRTTKFVDALLVSSAPLIIADLMDLFPILNETLRALTTLF